MIDPFAPFKIKGLEVRNRFVRSGTYDGTPDAQGRATDASAAIYGDLARGGVGLIITASAFVSLSGQSSRSQYGIHSEEMIPGLRRLTEAAHAGGARIAAQINHSGLLLRYQPGPGEYALAPSLKEGYPAPHRTMTGAEIEATIADFGSAAVRAREAGFDAVQLHAAHGYLLSQFFSPLFNRRTDQWGGSPANRRRLHVEVVKEVRRRVGRDYPVLAKFGVMDDDQGGATLQEGIEAARRMAVAGVDAIEVSSGVGRGPRELEAANQRADLVQPFFQERVAAVRKAVPVPVIEVGGIRSLSTITAILNAGLADMISMCRPLIREPGLIARWQQGDAAAAKCISCSRCFEVITKEHRLGCYQELHPAG